MSGVALAMRQQTLWFIAPASSKAYDAYPRLVLWTLAPMSTYHS